MITAVRRLLALAGLARSRVALSIALGVLAVGFGVALIAAAGYLISRAAEQPPILSLTTIIVTVRFRHLEGISRACTSSALAQPGRPRPRRRR